MSALRHAYICDTRLQGNPLRFDVINVLRVFQPFRANTFFPPRIPLVITYPTL